MGALFGCHFFRNHAVLFRLRALWKLDYLGVFFFLRFFLPVRLFVRVELKQPVTMRKMRR